MGEPQISVIVNTLNRAESLRRALASFRHLIYDEFEVIVVDGPSTDGTDAVLAEFSDLIKIRRCSEANLSMSRNIGIASAGAELVAFIDDDAIPEPQWLNDLVSAHNGDDVAASGGLVIDHTGYGLQCRYNSCDRLGNARYDSVLPLDEMCFPGSMRFPYVPGGNALWRRDLLIEVGGFDEEYEYYLDEVDVCVRLIDKGYLLRQHSRAAIHHKFLASNLRNEGRILLNRFSVIKNKIYFAMTNARPFVDTAGVMIDCVRFSALHVDDLNEHLKEGRISDEEHQEATESVERGWLAGLSAGMRGSRRLYDADGLAPHAEPFRRFPSIPAPNPRLRLAFLSQTLPPNPIGGIGRYMLDLGRELGRRGHEVRILTDGEDHDTMDFEGGVWVHRLIKESSDPKPDDLPLTPPRIWFNAARLGRELQDIAAFDHLDAVYSALWDVESIGGARRTAAPNLVALVTTLAITLRTRPEWRDDPTFMEALGQPLIDLERHVMQTAEGIHAISEAILNEVEFTSAITLDRNGVRVGHLGLADRFPAAAPRVASDTSCRILFVGRFEKRKGIDALLGALPDLLASRPEVSVELIGRHDLPGEDGRPYWDLFVEAHADASWLPRVVARGEVDDVALDDAYAACDIFVAPSRFESFGLIYVEAMAASRPVVAARAGAAPEVVVDGTTGLLVEPGDSESLRDALVSLLDDPAGRLEMSLAGRGRYEEHFTVAAMADRFLELVEAVEMIPVTDDRWVGGAALPTTSLPDGSAGGLLSCGSSIVLDLVGTGRRVVIVHLTGDARGEAEATIGDGQWSTTLRSDFAPGFRHVVVDDRTGKIEVRSGPSGQVAVVGLAFVRPPAGAPHR